MEKEILVSEKVNGEEECELKKEIGEDEGLSADLVVLPEWDNKMDI